MFLVLICTLICVDRFPYLIRTHNLYIFLYVPFRSLFIDIVSFQAYCTKTSYVRVTTKRNFFSVILMFAFSLLNQDYLLHENPANLKTTKCNWHLIDFVDYKKQFDSIEQEVICNAWSRNYRTHYKITSFNANTQPWSDCWNTNEIIIHKGVSQGCSLTKNIYNMYWEYFSKKLGNWRKNHK